MASGVLPQGMYACEEEGQGNEVVYLAQLIVGSAGDVSVTVRVTTDNTTRGKLFADLLRITLQHIN